MTEKENKFKVGIKYEDDGDDYFLPGIAGFGETEKEAKEDLKNKIIPC